MALYTLTNVGIAANTTAATAGLWKIEQGATLCSPKIYTVELGPNANSADNTYNMQVKRQTSQGSWNLITAALLDSTHEAAALAQGASGSSTAGAASTILMNFGYHMRAGYRWVSIPGGELAVAVSASNGIIGAWTFAQGTDSHSVSVWFNE